MMAFTKPVDYRIKNYDHFIVHCTATSPSMNNVDASWVDREHKKKGWSGCGYHAVICRDGSLQMDDTASPTRPVDKTGAHVGGCGPGWNKRSFGVSLVGGIDEHNKPENNFTEAQFDSLFNIIEDFKDSHPSPHSIKVMGHRDLIAQTHTAAKACPCFDVADFIANRLSNKEDEDSAVQFNNKGILTLPENYTVKQDDSLWKIAHTYGLSVEQIKRINKLNRDAIHPGQILKIPTEFLKPSVRKTHISVDPKKPRKILVVHGVQTGSDNDQNQDDLVSNLIKNRLGNIPLKFKTELYCYENINDEAQKKYKKLAGLILQTPIGKIVADKAIDLIGDVVTSYQDTSTAAEIRAGLKDRILEIFRDGNPCYLVAHSLGTIYAFDVLNELMRENQYFDRNSRKTWPVQGLLTLGSPIGLDMFKQGGRTEVASLGAGDKWFRWLNFWDRTDPVVSGNIFGQQLSGYAIAEKYQSASLNQGWVMRDKAIDTGKVWLMAHVAYWDNPIVGDSLVDMITN
jgi:LysM repeat protein